MSDGIFHRYLEKRYKRHRIFGKLWFSEGSWVKIGLKTKSKILSDSIFFLIEILFLRDPTDLKKKANADPSLREVSLVI